MNELKVKATRVLSQSDVIELLSYNPITGEFTHRTRDPKWFKGESINAANRWNARTAMKTAAKIDPVNGHMVINMLYKKYSASKIAFLYMAGFIPETVGRRDKDLSNLKWDNLFVSTKSNDTKRHFLRSDSTTGVTGVYYYSHGLWLAKASDNGKKISLGYFKTLLDAACARKSHETSRSGDDYIGFSLFRDTRNKLDKQAFIVRP